MAAIIVTGAASACTFLGPKITCDESVNANECRLAVDTARPLLAAYWDDASEVFVHAGPCTLSRHCSARFGTDPGWLTVDLVSDQPEAAFVVIDRHNAQWTAECAVTVRTSNGAHGEACAKQ